MEMMEAMLTRHSVRSYTDKPIEGETLEALVKLIDECNRESGLHIQLVRNEPMAFAGTMAHYGKFSGVTNYLALVGKKSPKLDELCGYYGEKQVLAAQALGLNTCWVGLTFKKIPAAFRVESGEKLVIVIAIGSLRTSWMCRPLSRLHSSISFVSASSGSPSMGLAV